MKEIEFDGVEVKGKLSVKMVGGGEVSTSKVNTKGMLFETTNHLRMNSHYKFQISYGDKKVNLGAKVMRILLKGTVKKDDKEYTLSHVAVDFENMGKDEEAFLDSIIEQILEDSVPALGDGTHGTKFRVTD